MRKRALFWMVSMTLAMTVGIISLAQARQGESLLTGTAKVTNIRSGFCTNPDRLRICQERTSSLFLETNDSRLNGEASLLFDTITDNRSIVEQSRGFFRLQNGAGAWVGSWTGSIESDGHTQVTVEAYGKGRFAGLIARWQMERSNPNGWEPLTVIGAIQREPLFARKR